MRTKVQLIENKGFMRDGLAIGDTIYVQVQTFSSVLKARIDLIFYKVVRNNDVKCARGDLASYASRVKTQMGGIWQSEGK